jgi:uncharacterized protein DUF5666
MSRIFRFPLLVLLLAVPLLAACASGPLGGPVNVPPASRVEFRGTVDQVDTSARRISMRDRDNGGNRDVYYDESSVVQYGNERYEPRSLERGDEVTVVAHSENNRFWAETITVTYDATAGDGGTRDEALRTLRGVVDRIDTRDRRLDLEVTEGSSARRVESIYWDDNSQIAQAGRRYDIRDLRQGDRVDVSARYGSNGYYAERIELVDQVGDSGDLPGALRGTVTRVDTQARRIDLEGAAYDSLRPGGEQRSSSVYYDDRTTVEYGGKRYSPDSLERGDQIAIEGRNVNGRYLADRIVVTHDTRNSR